MRFVREVAARGEREKIDVNIIEAFDQPWKRALEGAMGGAWGLFDADGNARSQNKALYVKDSHWWRGWLASLVGAMVGLSLTFALKHKRLDKTIFMLAFALAGTLLPAQIDFIRLWSRTTQEMLMGAFNAAMVIAGSLALLAMNMMRKPSTRERQLALIWAAMLFTAATSALVLLADPRYRGFSLALYALPAIVSIAVLFRPEGVFAYRRSTRFLSAILIFAALGMLYQEKISNTEAVILFTYWLCIALPAWLSAWLSPSFTLIARSPANNSATAQSSGV